MKLHNDPKSGLYGPLDGSWAIIDHSRVKSLVLSSPFSNISECEYRLSWPFVVPKMMYCLVIEVIGFILTRPIEFLILVTVFFRKTNFLGLEPFWVTLLHENTAPEKVAIMSTSFWKSWKCKYRTYSGIVASEISSTPFMILYIFKCPVKSPIAARSLSFDNDAPEQVILNIPYLCSSTWVRVSEKRLSPVFEVSINLSFTLSIKILSKFVFIMNE